MKKKQFMSKLAALTMAAAMGLTAVPSTVFAQTVSIEQSDATTGQTAAKDQISVTVTATGAQDDDATKEALVKLLTGQNLFDSSTPGTLNTAAQTKAQLESLLTASAITNDSAKGNSDSKITQDGVVTNVKYDGDGTLAKANKLTFTVSFDQGEIFDVTIDETAATGTDLSTVTAEASAYAELNNYFANKTFYTAKGVTPTVTDIVKALNADQAAGGDFAAGKAYADIMTGSYSFSSSGAQLKKNDDGTYTGTLVATKTASGTNYNYTFTAKVEEVEDSTQDLLDAIATVEKNTYASPNTNTNHTSAQLKQKIVDDINAVAGRTVVSTTDLTNEVLTPARKTNNYTGRYTVTAKKIYQISVALKKSSDDQSKDTNDSIATVNKAGTAATTGTGDIFLYDSAKKAANTKLDGTKVITFTDHSALSTSIQGLTAKKAATAADVKAGVEKAISDQLTKDKVDNDVKVDVSVYTDGYYAKSADTNNDGALSTTEITAGTIAGKDSVEATASHPGKFYVLVKTSVANDFKGWGSDNAKDKTETYLYNIALPQLKAESATALDVADKTVDLGDGYTQTVGTTKTKGDVITVDATLTPADANDEITWTVKNSKGDTVSTSLANVTDKDGRAFNVKANQLAFFVPTDGADKYTVTAEIGDLKDTATISVVDSFSDALSKNAFYYNAVKWAKTNEISSGVGDNTFGVNRTITRKEFVSWLYKVAQKSNKLTEVKGDVDSLKFTDVPKDSYYAEAVAWGAANGIVYGKNDTTFNPNGEVTRGQAITFIWRLAGKPDSGAAGTQLDATTKFDDVKANQFFTTAVTWGVNTDAYNPDTEKIVSGTSTTTFSPAKTCNRAQAMSFIYRAFGGDVQ